MALIVAEKGGWSC